MVIFSKKFPKFLKHLNEVNVLIWILFNEDLQFISKFCFILELVFTLRKRNEIVDQ